jgi:hypothetical protein
MMFRWTDSDTSKSFVPSEKNEVRPTLRAPSLATSAPARSESSYQINTVPVMRRPYRYDNRRHLSQVLNAFANSIFAGASERNNNHGSDFKTQPHSSCNGKAFSLEYLASIGAVAQLYLLHGERSNDDALGAPAFFALFLSLFSLSRVLSKLLVSSKNVPEYRSGCPIKSWKDSYGPSKTLLLLEHGIDTVPRI